jgi:molybdate transport system regulatory protein
LNRVFGEIVKIDYKDNFSVVEVNTKLGNLLVVVLETPETASYLKEMNYINLLFNPAELLIFKIKDENLLNMFDCKIIEIEKGKLLSNILLEKNGIKLESIVLTKQVNKYNLKIGDKVFCHIKPASIFFEVV